MKHSPVIPILLVVVSIMLAIGSEASAGNFYDHLDYGIEWGYTATFQYQYDFLYLSENGTKVDSDDNSLTYKSNGFVHAFAGFKFARILSLNACFGWAGVYEGRRVYPLTLRAGLFPKGYGKDGFKFLFEGGRCIAGSFHDQKINLVRVGAGYRVMLSHNIAIDFTLCAQMVSDHPTDVYDPKNGVIVDNSALLYSNTHYSGLGLMMSLTF